MKNPWKPIYIGGEENPYLVRRVLFSCPLFGVMLHKICWSDHDRALHDHPWGFVSFILSGGYTEQFGDPADPKVAFRGPGSVLFRPATWRHRVIKFPGDRPAWTMVFKGPRLRRWGFWVKTWEKTGHAVRFKLNGMPVSAPTEKEVFKWCWWRQYDENLGICGQDIIHTFGED